MKKLNRRLFIYASHSALALLPSAARAKASLPQGLMLNLDFSRTTDGLIPSKTLYPLHVPIGKLKIEDVNGKHILGVRAKQGLSIPHSSLLDPDGREWVVSVRAFMLEDGLILSQGNDKHGLAIYMTEHTIQAVIRSGNTALTLKEDEYMGITKYRKRWVTIEIRVKRDRAFLLLNRKIAAMVPLEAPFAGKDMRLRIGTHSTLPAVLKNKPYMQTNGFQGGIASLKIFRQ